MQSLLVRRYYFWITSYVEIKPKSRNMFIVPPNETSDCLFATPFAEATYKRPKVLFTTQIGNVFRGYLPNLNPSPLPDHNHSCSTTPVNNPGIF